MTKENEVGFITKKLRSEYLLLGEGKYEGVQLFKFIQRAIDDLKKNPGCGIKIPKNLWPKGYVKEYHITNLWKYDLPNGWRLIYTIETNEVLIVAIILEWMDHTKYERKFKY